MAISWMMTRDGPRRGLHVGRGLQSWGRVNVRQGTWSRSEDEAM